MDRAESKGCHDIGLPQTPTSVLSQSWQNTGRNSSGARRCRLRRALGGAPWLRILTYISNDTQQHWLTWVLKDMVAAAATQECSPSEVPGSSWTGHDKPRAGDMS